MASYKLSDAQLAGQRLMAGFHGQSLNHEVRTLIADLHVGGLILFKRNVSDPSQLRELCHSAQSLAAQVGDPPLIISIDQEGGPVARLGHPFTVFEGNRAIGRARSHEMASAFGRICASELREAGITMNLAPTLDVIPEGLENGVMANRVFGYDPTLVAELGVAEIEALQDNGIAATAKHFPGIGRTVLDSHIDLPTLTTSSSDLDASDLEPFRMAMRHKVSSIMLSHIIYTDLDPLWPASLSVAIGKELLRDRLGFDAVAMTDDLEMGAIDGRFPMETIIERVFEAHIDIALICHTIEKTQTAHDAFKKIVQSSDAARSIMLASVTRILNLKRRFPISPI